MNSGAAPDAGRQVAQPLGVKLLEVLLFLLLNGLLVYLEEAAFREFVDAEVTFPHDSDTDRLRHYEFGLHTALNRS